MRVREALIRMGSVVCGPLATLILFSAGALKCGGGETADFTGGSAGTIETGGSDTGSGGTGGSDLTTGGSATGGSAGSAEGGSGGAGGSGGDVTTGAGATGTGGAATGGSGGTGGAIVAGCLPPSSSGTNCADATCGPIAGYDLDPGTCGATCSPEALAYDVAILSEQAFVFDDFSQGAGCDACQWSFVLRMVVAGPGACVRATVSDGLRVSKVYEPTTCGAASDASCVVAQPQQGPTGTQLRIVATVDPANVPAAGWLRIETELANCAESALVCP